MKITLKLLIALVASLSSPIFANEPISQGESLYKANCAACHGVTGGMDMSKRIAPPIIAVRMHYLQSYSDELSFVDAVSSWVANPQEENTQMPGAVRRFGLMPKMDIPMADLEKIALYVYQGNVDKPEGFDKHYEEMHGKKGKGKHKKSNHE